MRTVMKESGQQLGRYTRLEIQMSPIAHILVNVVKKSPFHEKNQQSYRQKPNTIEKNWVLVLKRETKPLVLKNFELLIPKRTEPKDFFGIHEIPKMERKEELKKTFKNQKSAKNESDVDQDLG